MNNEPSDREIRDEQLTAAYRSLSNERVPERLDEQVLREASRALRSPYAPPIRWSRPLAWVAVVAITFGILLQIADLPTPETGEPGLPEAVGREGGPGGVADDDLAEQPQPLSEAPAGDPVALRQDVTAAEAAEPEGAPPLRKAETVEAAESPGRPSFTVQSTALPESGAQSRSGRVAVEAQPPLPEAAALADRSAVQESPECSDAERADPESWYACIERLRETGLDTAADEQLEALRAAFPDFEPPR